jgi:hypothetical protein
MLAPSNYRYAMQAGRHLDAAKYKDTLIRTCLGPETQGPEGSNHRTDVTVVLLPTCS